METFEKTVNKNLDEISKKAVSEMIKQYFGRSINLKDHKVEDLPWNIFGVTEIECNSSCKVIGKYINKKLFDDPNLSKIIRTQTHEHTHEALSYILPGITKASYFNPYLHEMLAEYLPYKWLKDSGYEILANQWIDTSPYPELIKIAERIDKKRGIIKLVKELDSLYEKVANLYKHLT